jgi:hypothetical protein
VLLDDDVIFLCIADDFECALDAEEGGGLQVVSGTPANGYVLEDGVTFYVAEDNTTFYVQEV